MIEDMTAAELKIYNKGVVFGIEFSKACVEAAKNGESPEQTIEKAMAILVKENSQ